MERPAEIVEELEAFRSRRHILSVSAARSRSAFNAEQHTLYPAAPKLHLIQGKAGRGKTFVIHAIVNYLRSTEKVVAVSGVTGLCASAFERESTAYRLFEIRVEEPSSDVPLVSRIAPGLRRT
ncbi:hypothetical protein OC834_006096 [Tilletia horrida]|nr:hypothetical protein OC834_006096 [Tilletia horrida]